MRARRRRFGKTCSRPGVTTSGRGATGAGAGLVRERPGLGVTNVLSENHPFVGPTFSRSTAPFSPSGPTL